MKSHASQEFPLEHFIDFPPQYKLTKFDVISNNNRKISRTSLYSSFEGLIRAADDIKAVPFLISEDYKDNSV